MEAAVCPFCACLCDDIVVLTEGNKIKEIRNACKLGMSKFLSVDKENRIKIPMIEGKEVEYAEGIEKAAEILKKANKPLIYGLSNSGYNAQHAALKIARKKKGVFDTTDSICHNLFYLQMQKMEHSFYYATLDEIRDKANVVIYWGCNPLESHPRHLSRFSVYPIGRYVLEGAVNREVIHIDVAETKLKKISKWFLKVKAGEDFKIAEIMRKLVKGETKGLRELIEDIEEGKFDTIGKIAESMSKAFYGVIFLGLGVLSNENATENIKSIFSLVEELNKKGARFVIFPMKGHFNVFGASQLLLRETGYPFGVDFSSHNIFEAGRTTVLDIIEEIDTALIIGADPFSSFSMEKAKKLRDIPIILIDPFESITTQFSTIALPSAITGIEAEEIAYRMDGLPLKLQKIIDCEYPTDNEILEEIYKRL